MSLPFDNAEFFAVFFRYNQAIWPAQLVFYALAVGVLLMLLARVRYADRAASAVLAVLWAWAGLVYHGIFFREINPAAPLFGALFVAGAAAFAWEGVLRGRLVFRTDSAVLLAAGVALIVYALLFYPLLGIVFGHAYPSSPTLGVPCPTAIFTLGLLLLSKPPYRVVVFAAPLVWALIASQAVFALRVWEDLGLLVAGVATGAALFHSIREVKAA
jgi:hypothetical protein